MPRIGSSRCSLPTTAAKDQIRKRALYERHGVREYWLIHPTDPAAPVHLSTGDRWIRQAGYLLPAVGFCTPTVIPDLVIDWNSVFISMEKTN